MREEIKAFMTEDEGVGVVEIILILCVLIGLVVIFRTKIESLVKKIFAGINSKAKTIY